MNCILAALNAKYTHTNLAVRSLKAAADQKTGIVLKEYTVNMPILEILANLYNPDVFLYGFSVYIWNIEMILKIVRLLKKLNPRAFILLGGPEVSFEWENLMRENPDVDYIIIGEGENAFPFFIDYLNGKKPVGAVPSLVYRSEGKICANEGTVACDLNSLPFPYDDLKNLSRRVIYYESSRGCPYHCAFCLSSVSQGVRYKDTELVKQDIDRFVNAGAMKVKFVDRTFNADKRRAKDILQYIIKKNCNTGFHFEISAVLLDDETVEILKQSPPGHIQIEAGIQSVHPETLSAIHRNENFQDMEKSLKKIIFAGNIHTHVDLIAGLPFESYADFKISFNSAFSIKADNLQLGFLKLLKGSELRKKAADYGIEYMPFAPYTVLNTNDISFEELNRLHKMEDLLQKYYNSGLFKYTVYYLAQLKQSAFAFFETLVDYIAAQKPEGEISQTALALYLYEFASSFADHHILKNIMRLDFCMAKSKVPLPGFLKDERDAFYEKEYGKQSANTCRSFRVTFFSIDINELINTGNILHNSAAWVFDYAKGSRFPL